MIIEFSNNKVFGKDFKTGKKNIYYAIGFLIVNNIITHTGLLNTKLQSRASKMYLWTYIYYLRMYNKNNIIFEKHLGRSNSLKATKMYNMVEDTLDKVNLKTSKKYTIVKQDLINFINILFKIDDSLVIPFNNNQKHKNVLIDAYTSSTPPDTYEVTPVIKLIETKENSLKYMPVNSKNADIKFMVSIDIDKQNNSNNIAKNTQNNSVQVIPVNVVQKNTDNSINSEKKINVITPLNTVTQISVIESNNVKSNIVTPNVTRPNVTKPVFIRPNVEKQNVAKPNVAKPVFIRPNVAKQNVVRPNVVRTNVVRTNVVRPNVVRTNVVRPNVIRTNVVRPNVVRQSNNTIDNK